MIEPNLGSSFNAMRSGEKKHFRLLFNFWAFGLIWMRKLSGKSGHYSISIENHHQHGQHFLKTLRENFARY